MLKKRYDCQVVLRGGHLYEQFYGRAKNTLVVRVDAERNNNNMDRHERCWLGMLAGRGALLATLSELLLEALSHLLAREPLARRVSNILSRVVYPIVAMLQQV